MSSQAPPRSRWNRNNEDPCCAWILYGKIAIQRMEEKAIVFDGKNFKSAGVQIVERLKRKMIRSTALYIQPKYRTRKPGYHE